MMRHVLLDTGPLVASINRHDRFHNWACSVLEQIAPPLLTCEPVVTESCFLLQKYPGAGAAILELVHRGVVNVNFRIEEHLIPVAKLMTKYRNMSMSLADACLVRMSEIQSQSAILTLDTHFKVYRRNGRQVIPIVMP